MVKGFALTRSTAKGVGGYKNKGFEAIVPFLAPPALYPNPGKGTNGEVPYIYILFCYSRKPSGLGVVR